MNLDNPMFLGYLKNKEERKLIKDLKAKPLNSKVTKKNKADNVIEAEKN